MAFRLLRQGFQPGTLQHLPADVVHERALRHRGQKTARLPHALQLGHGGGRGQQTQKGVLGQIGGFSGHAQPPQQPAAQPAVMIAIEQAQLAVLQRFRGRHGRSATVFN
ncbi:hypothetical protein D3C85_1510630 [compost metagenome]